MKTESALDYTPLDVDLNGPFGTSSVSTGSLSISGTWESNNPDDETFTADMKEDGMGNWKISSFSVDGSSIFK